MEAAFACRSTPDFYSNHAYRPVKIGRRTPLTRPKAMAPEDTACFARSPALSISTTASILPSGFSSGTTTALTILAESSASATQKTNSSEMTAISQQIQNQLTAKIAALQQTPDTSVANALQSQITTLQSQSTAVNQIASTAGGNAYTLSDLQTQLANLQTEAAPGNSAGFDATLSAANTDVLNLTATSPPAPFQPDGIAGLQGNGLGIGSSSSYGLSAPSGQAAAASAVQAAQTLVGQIFQTTTANQLLAGDIGASLTAQIGTLTAQQQTQSQSDQAATTAQIAQLTTLAQNQTHLIELALGGTSAIANMVSAADNPPQPYTSVFQALEGAVGATAASNGSQPPAILSLLA